MRKDQLPDPPRLLSVPEVAGALGCSERKIWQEIHAGRLAQTRIGRLVRVSQRVLMDYIDARTQETLDAKRLARDIITGKKGVKQ